MRAPKLNSIDDYELFLSKTIENWSPPQRAALAAAMAERWLPAYEKFSEEEDWGDPDSLRRSLEAVWNHVGGQSLGAANRAACIAQLRDSTPHMDDFDAEEALAACIMLSEALQCCATPKNHNHSMQAAMSGFQAVLPDWDLDPDSQPRLWQQIAVRKELRKQLKLIEEIGAVTRFDNTAIQTLRTKLSKPEYSGDVTPRSEPEAPAGLTNQDAFEQHRRMVEADIAGDERTPLNMELDDNAYLKAIIYFSKWANRYSRRRNNTDGEYGQLADRAGLAALIARQRALDATAPEMPAWDDEVRTVFEMCMANRQIGLDVNDLTQPHAYGPSLRRLWHEAKRQGKPDVAAWQAILEWAHHRPAAWQIADNRKKRGRAQENELGPKLGREVTWTATGDVHHPWSAEVDGQRWQIRITAFPDDVMYSLIIDGTVAGDFHDWPQTWRR